MTRRTSASTQTSHRSVALSTVGAVVLLAAAGVAVAVYASDQARTLVAAAPTGQADVAPAGTHRVGPAGSSGVTVVAFMDFASAASADAYPILESTRERYAGEVTFLIRHLPGSGSSSAVQAALAFEAAARQGEAERMYQRLLDTRDAWSGQDTSTAPQFRDFAADLGLDLARYDVDVADSDTLARVLRDQRDAVDLGADRGPAFFLTSADQLRREDTSALADAIRDELARR